MSELQDNLRAILYQKQSYIVPENIKKDITVLGVTGTYEGNGIDLTTGIKFGNSNMEELPDELLNANWSECTNTVDMFAWSQLVTFPSVEFSNVISADSMFASTPLQSIGSLDTSSCTSMNSMFAECGSLETIPIFDTSNVIDMSNFVLDCGELSNQSLENILEMIYNIDTASYIGGNTLFDIGLSSSQVETCRSFSRFQDILNKGWTTGY